jgi:hypothetical protein
MVHRARRRWLEPSRPAQAAGAPQAAAAYVQRRRGRGRRRASAHRRRGRSGCIALAARVATPAHARRCRRQPPLARGSRELAPCRSRRRPSRCACRPHLARRPTASACRRRRAFGACVAHASEASGGSGLCGADWRARDLASQAVACGAPLTRRCRCPSAARRRAKRHSSRDARSAIRYRYRGGSSGFDSRLKAAANCRSDGGNGVAVGAASLWASLWERRCCGSGVAVGAASLGAASLWERRLAAIPQSRPEAATGGARCRLEACVPRVSRS